MAEKILFVINNLETGGVQVSLQNLVKEINKSYEISIISLAYKNEYYKLLPQNVKLVRVNSPFKFLGVSQGELRGKPLQLLARSFWAILIKIWGRSNTIRLMSLFQKKIGPFDCAISYLHESPQKSVYGGCNEFLLRKVKAKKKIAWLHCDFERCGANNTQSHRIYEKFDKIVACSEGCRQAFIRCLPNLADKTVSIRNCNDYARIRQLAKDGVDYDKDYFNIITVARLSKEKGIDRAIGAVKQCIEEGHKVRYHIVGAGDQEDVLKSTVSELGLEKEILFYGNQKNPYRYMKNADLFLLTSYHEAAPMVFDEAACLGVPVLATETTSTFEMLESCSHGIVCGNDILSIKKSILSILTNSEAITRIRESLKSKRFSNEISAKKVMEILDGGK